ncbi:DUF814 domain-containing protein [Candidatus Woesearchaeota archaeon]|nr:DUF814 domain-containing protein [Candidatus Woesearchaeota archaeon]
MKIVLSLMKSLEENAQSYFEKAKKAKKKAEGAHTAIIHWEAQKKKLLQEEEKTVQKTPFQTAPKKWYHKFRWFKTSDGFLVLGGRDATTNEIVIKKHTAKEDLVFHTDMAGSPFFVIQSEGRKISQQAIAETADATCTFSRAFQLGLSTQSVFSVQPEQVSKEAQAGEYLAKGAFMIRGKTTYVENKINLALGITPDYEIMAGPYEAVKQHCKTLVRIRQGKEKVSNIAKKIAKQLSYQDLDAIIRALPAGTFDLVN